MMSLLIGSLSIFNSSAQEEIEYGFKKGDLIISGAINYSTNSSKSKFDTNDLEQKIKSNTIAIIPEVGYFISNHFAAGARIGYLWSKSENQNSSTYTNKQDGFTTGVFGRYYINPDKRVNFFAEIASNYRKTTSESTNNDLNSLSSSGSGEQKSYSVYLTPGINIFLTQNLSLTSRIGTVGYSKSEQDYHSIEGDYRSSSENDSFTASLSLDNFYFGVLYSI